jgi:hypothetical protein
MLHADPSLGGGSSYNDGSDHGDYRDSSGQQTGYGVVSGQQGVYSGTSGQQNNYDDSYGQQASDDTNCPQQGGHEDVSNSAQQGGYEDVSEQQAGYEDVSGHQGGYKDASEQQNGYSSGTGAMANTNASSHGGDEYGNNQNSSYAGSSGNSARQGLQAQGRGFGQGFNAGFGQGLSGDPDGSQPHEGVTVEEEVGPDSASRDTDLVHIVSLHQWCCEAVCTLLANHSFQQIASTMLRNQHANMHMTWALHIAAASSALSSMACQDNTFCGINLCSCPKHVVA